MSEVSPFVLWASFLAPTEIRYFTTSRCPLFEAQINEVYPSSSLAPVLAL
ncbi:hypothetical protein TVAG_386860 [Trichomonas vaginalis G3]|uniref:Uncharacterized protein n=1 Tax=Trichomonas vaginalis (strain ATCC PRA-98 / G3) TaxID=412133 RepID=A2FY64_TRIV3|nr:hypothetical protein TVAGG3_0819530 [Trichomonas vaginalis G3]EAX90156.1 hypothetical protein TVAG_386860 [Trichomonas vaginalis G3]KAI5497773.1 hypothetical protein TVAGG3_0819530 [Trichomonas vaginalis G3]|eukprot:XP_001303086.1 hypothetical protein [Trichomonas vaginalis G3]